MDAVDQTAREEDALPKGETKACDDAGPKTTVKFTCGTGDGEEDLKVLNEEKGEKKETVATKEADEASMFDMESGDDYLLAKIELVVKDDGTSNGKATDPDSAIAESSEQDFLKRLEDVEHETDKDDGKKNEEDDGAGEVEECVTSSDEKEKAAAGNASAPEETDETDRALSDNIVDSTSQELEAKISEKASEPVEEEKEAESSEEVTEIISSEDDENAEQKEHAKSGAKSEVVVEISSDDGSNEVSLVEKSNSDNEVQLVNEETAEKEAQSSTVDEEAVILENGDVDIAAPDTSEASPAETSEVLGIESGKKSETQAEIADVSSEEQAEIDSSEPKTSDVVVSEVAAESQVPTDAEKIKKSIAAADTEPMSVDTSPANDDTMEVDEEEKMDVEMVENLSENEEEMPAAIEIKANMETAEKAIDETVAAKIDAVSTTATDATKIDAVSTTATVAATIDAVSTTATVATDLLEAAAEVKEVQPADTSAAVAESVKETDGEDETVVEVNEAEATVPIEVKKVEIEIREPIKKESNPTPTLEQTVSKSSPLSTPSKISDADTPIEIIELSSEETVVESTNDEKNKQEDVIAVVEKSTSGTEHNVKPTTESDCEKTTAAAIVKSSLGLRVENKLLANTMKHGGSVASLDGSPVSAASGGNVFNSTPIQKQFEISSENVSKISEANDEANRTEEAQLSKTEEESTDIGTTTTSESDNQTDSVTKYLNVIKQYNGIAAAEEKPVPLKPTQKISQKSNFDFMPAELLSSQVDLDSKKSQYEISVWYEERDIRFLSVEKLDNKKSMHATLETTSGGDSSEKLSSNGSVSSLPPFTLPNHAVEMSLSGSSMGSQKTSDLKPNFPTHGKRSKHTVTGIVELCTFMIDQFTKIKHEIEPPKPTEPTTPKSKGRGVSDSIKKSASKGKSASPPVLSSSAEGGTEVDETPTKKIDKRTLKRTLNKSSISDDDDESKPKAAKQSKTTSQQKTPSKNADPVDLSVIGYSVLAKWVDKKYYAGKVTDARAGNKFVILFEDGASKVLPKESVVFGEEDILPLQDQSVYALMDDDYEVGLVKSIAKDDDDKVIYTVEINEKLVKVSASDIYITDQQAKAIQSLRASGPSTPTSSASFSSSATKGGVASSDTPIEKSSPGGNTTAASRSTRNKRQATSPITPEAGFSGGVTKRGRRQKRPSFQQKRISESSDISDSPEMSNPAPSSPESALEAIEGVQPELQKTPKESEISRMMIISDYMKQEPTRDISELLGPLPISKTLFKNKCFILTCTVGQKLPPKGNISMNNFNEIAFKNKNAVFSTVPFIKQQLHKQIQEGGGTVYNHFEDIPKTKYKQCKLISNRPCTTAKYVQCLAADIQPISHEWIIESCTKNIVADFKKYLLPSGWSITNETYIQWTLRKSDEYRQSNKPLLKEIVLIASEHDDFVTFWSRVCKLAGATLRYVKKLGDVTPTTSGYMVTEQDFPQVIKSKAEHYGIPIVSTLWIVQSLISGKVCDPLSHGKFTQIYQDDDL